MARVIAPDLRAFAEVQAEVERTTVEEARARVGADTGCWNM